MEACAALQRTGVGGRIGKRRRVDGGAETRNTHDLGAACAAEPRHLLAETDSVDADALTRAKRFIAEGTCVCDFPSGKVKGNFKL